MQTLARSLSHRHVSLPETSMQPRLKSQELFRGTNELIIEHQGQEYRLRLTRNDKLILNK